MMITTTMLTGMFTHDIQIKWLVFIYRNPSRNLVTKHFQMTKTKIYWLHYVHGTDYNGLHCCVPHIQLSGHSQFTQIVLFQLFRSEGTAPICQTIVTFNRHIEAWWHLYVG